MRLAAWGVAQVVFRQHNGTAKMLLHTRGGFTLGYRLTIYGPGRSLLNFPGPRSLGQRKRAEAPLGTPAHTFLTGTPFSWWIKG